MKRFSGQLLKEARERQELTQPRLALALSNHYENRIVPAQSISDWERAVYSPNAESLAALSKVLGCSIDHFFAEEVYPSIEST